VGEERQMPERGERYAMLGYLAMILLTAAVATFIVSWINAACF